MNVVYTLIGYDGGDGGFSNDFTDEDGRVLLTGYCGPGRYQIRLTSPAGSRFSKTSFSSPELLLTVAKDGSYHPTEYRISAFND